MSGTNAFVTFDYEAFDDAVRVPHGVCFALSVNPFNGLAIMRYVDDDDAMGVVDDLLRQVLDKMAFVSFADFVDECKFANAVARFDKCPFCGGEPQYVFDSPVSLRDSHSGLFPGHISCCGGKTNIGGFGTKLEAVEFWNKRDSRVVV